MRFAIWLLVEALPSEVAMPEQDTNKIKKVNKSGTKPKSWFCHIWFTRQEVQLHVAFVILDLTDGMAVVHLVQFKQKNTLDQAN